MYSKTVKLDERLSGEGEILPFEECRGLLSFKVIRNAAASSYIPDSTIIKFIPHYSTAPMRARLSTMMLKSLGSAAFLLPTNSVRLKSLPTR